MEASMIILIKLIVNAIAIFLTAQILPGVELANLTTALLVAIVLAGINMFIKPIVLIFTLPINVITLGLFTFVINGLFILLASNIVDGFNVPNFWHAILFALVLSIVNSFLVWIVK
jgi:putative membrane protein